MSTPASATPPVDPKKESAAGEAKPRAIAIYRPTLERAATIMQVSATQAAVGAEFTKTRKEVRERIIAFEKALVEATVGDEVWTEYFKEKDGLKGPLPVIAGLDLTADPAKLRVVVGAQFPSLKDAKFLDTLPEAEKKRLQEQYANMRTAWIDWRMSLYATGVTQGTDVDASNKQIQQEEEEKYHPIPPKLDTKAELEKLPIMTQKRKEKLASNELADYGKEVRPGLYANLTEDGDKFFIITNLDKDVIGEVLREFASKPSITWDNLPDEKKKDMARNACLLAGKKVFFDDGKGPKEDKVSELMPPDRPPINWNGWVKAVSKFEEKEKKLSWRHRELSLGKATKQLLGVIRSAAPEEQIRILASLESEQLAHVSSFLTSAEKKKLQDLHSQQISKLREAKDLETSKASIEAEIKALDDSQEELTDTEKSYLQELKGKQAEIKKLEEAEEKEELLWKEIDPELVAAKKDLKEKESAPELAAAKEDLLSKRSELMKAEEEPAKKELELTTARKDLADKKTDLATEKKELEKKELELTAAKEGLVEKEKVLAGEGERHLLSPDNLAAATEEEKAARQKAETITAELAAAKQRVTTLTAGVEEAEKRVTTLTAGVEEAEKKVTTLTAGVEEAEKKGVILTTGVADAKKKIDDLKPKVADAEKKVGDLEAGLSKARGRVTTLTASIDDAKRKVDALKEKIGPSSEFSKKIAELKKKAQSDLKKSPEHRKHFDALEKSLDRSATLVIAGTRLPPTARIPEEERHDVDLASKRREYVKFLGATHTLKEVDGIIRKPGLTTEEKITVVAASASLHKATQEDIDQVIAQAVTGKKSPPSLKLEGILDGENIREKIAISCLKQGVEVSFVGGTQPSQANVILGSCIDDEGEIDWNRALTQLKSKPEGEKEKFFELAQKVVGEDPIEKECFIAAAGAIDENTRPVIAKVAPGLEKLVKEKEDRLKSRYAPK